MSSGNPSARGTRARKRQDYRQLNDGSDDEADIAGHMEQSNIVSNLFNTSVNQPIE